MTDNLSDNEKNSERIETIREQRKLNKQSEAYRSPETLRKAKQDFNDLKNAHRDARDVLSWEWEDWRNLFNADVREVGKVAAELVTKKKLKSLKANLKEEEKKDKVAKKMFELTGSLPGEKSGVVKNEENANKTVEEHLYKVKISAARMLAYGKDDKLKEKVMTEINGKYPEIVKDINSLAKKARKRANNDEFVKTTTGSKFAQNQLSKDR